MLLETCFFFGGYDLPGEQIIALPQRVGAAIDDLVDRGVTRFLSAGLPAFDIICAEYVLGLKAHRPAISLRFVLPCRDMSPFYPPCCLRDFETLLTCADGVVSVGKSYNKGDLAAAVRRMQAESTHVLYVDRGAVRSSGCA